MKECKIVNGIFQIYEFPNDKDRVKFPTILMLHGFTGNHLEPSFLFARFSKIAAKNGYATVRFDFRGSGNSDGEFYNMTSESELRDALEITKIIKEDDRFDKDNIFVLGLSMGGTISLRLVGKEPNIFKGCILWSAASLNKEIFSKSLEESKDKMIKTENGYDVGGIEIGENFIEEVLSYDAINESKKFKGPYLLIHGSNDPTVPLEVSKKATSLLPHSELHIIEEADHTYRSVKWSKELFEISLRFLKDHAI
jgi:dipeptidyl aminopeptidase/acylaminoacyl peptidase